MRTPLGRKIYAVGGNAQAAALSGIRVNRVLIVTYMVSGFCAAVVGLIIASELQAAHPATGDTFELNAIAAAVLGGASLAGGRGTIVGTRSEEHTSELQSLMRISYAVFCLKKKN